MAKKSITTRELVNIYPEWAKIRSDDQSIGFQLLNELAKPLEVMDKQLEHMRKNEFLSTINLDEIDLTYKVILPTTFEFTFNNNDPTAPVPQAPDIEGYVINTTFTGYVDVAVSNKNDLQSFWYDSVPNRATIDTTANGDFELLSQSANDFPWSGTLDHHLVDDNEGGGRVWIEATGGTQFITKNDQNDVLRGRVVLKGTTRKGIEEEETIVFPWNEKQPSLKEWKRLSEINVFDMEDDVEIAIRSADFNSPPYWSFYNLRFSDNRTKIDEFWQLSTAGTKLERVGLITDEWQQAMLGFSDKETKDTWDLIGSDWNYAVTGVDMAVQPFTDRIWLVTSNGVLYCYSLDETMASGVNNLEGRSSGPLAQIECNTRRITLGEDIVFLPWLARPIKEIIRYRVWYQDPSGTKYGILDGVPVSYTSDFWDVGRQIKRMMTDEITITSTLRGEYLLVLETQYVDDTTDSDRVIVQVQYKQPLVSIDLSNQITGTVQGIDFDSDQRMWLKADNLYYRVGLHTDIALIDYKSKILYFKENYHNVKVTL